MSHPRVSVCLPNLNNAPFLPERLETIFQQTFTDWELVISDNYSDDGAWEVLQRAAQRDSRVVLARAPREGMYANWNRCIERARGEFIYVATSDDTMPPECLAKLVAALDEHPQCDLAHCLLRIIDENGIEKRESWYETGAFRRTSGDLFWRPHVRQAPFDGLLHLFGESVYISATQLLIRRSLFDRIGVYEPQWGSPGDFHWNMRASLHASTVHVPDTWGGWRLHSQQATAAAGIGSDAHAASIDTMIEDAVKRPNPSLPSPIAEKLRGSWTEYARQCRAFDRNVKQCDGLLARAGLAAREVVKGSPAATRFVARQLAAVPDWRNALLDDIHKTMAVAGRGPALVTPSTKVLIVNAS